MNTKLGTLVMLCIFIIYSAKADMVLEDFNTARVYSTNLDSYGAYLAFEGNTFQAGDGVLTVQATDNGGFYHEGFGSILWNLTAKTNLMLTACRLPDNQASNCVVVLRDLSGNYASYSFPMLSFATNALTSISKYLLTPDWQTDGTFDFSSVAALDVHGGFTDDDLPFAMTFDSLTVIGPDVVDLRLKWSLETNVFVLKWNAQIPTLLQSSTNLGGEWHDETNVPDSGISVTFLSPLNDSSKFFRLLPQTNLNLLAQNLLATSGRTGNTTSSSGFTLHPMGDPTPLPNPDPGTNPPAITYYTNFIDIASYTGNSTNWLAAYSLNAVKVDYEREYSLSYNSHTGGQDHFDWKAYTNLTYHPEIQDGYRWVRNDNSYDLFSWSTTWTSSDTNWPSGWRIESGSNELRTATSPYLVEADIPWAKINMQTNIDPMVNGNWCHAWSCASTGLVSRFDDMNIHLHTGLNFSNYNYKYVLVTGLASKVNSLSVDINNPYTPDGGSLVPLESVTGLSWSNITVLGQPLNADNCVMIKAAPASTSDATPIITGANNYIFAVDIVQHSVQSLTRLYHPLFEVPPFTVPVPKIKDLQDHFNNGTDFLASDDDVKIADDDPQAAYSTNTSSVYLSDDVPTYVEFELANGPTVTNVLTRRTGPVFPAAFKSPEFYRVRSNASADALLNMSDATIKIVKTLRYDGDPVDGLAPVGTSSILLIHTLPGVAGPHEWGHTRGLHHRGTIDNPGPVTDALMNPYNYASNCKVNRFEHGTLTPP